MKRNAWVNSIVGLCSSPDFTEGKRVTLANCVTIKVKGERGKERI
jgi:hypothetical protein